MKQQSPKIEPAAMSTAPAATAGPMAKPAPVSTGPIASKARTGSLTREVSARYVWAITRLSLGFVFLWAFLDKTFGLGHETASADSWINGGNPTEGFLSGSVGPFAGIYQDIAGAGWVNVLFMVGLLGIGAALMLGIVMRLACAAGALMVVLMWTASLPPENNLFMDDHVIYALVLVGLALVGAGNTLGLGRWWAQTGIVKRHGWLA
jgi:thiosulfate dehydrogenase [quinone] large subunit